jgi:hypothetical protein
LVKGGSYVRLFTGELRLALKTRLIAIIVAKQAYKGEEFGKRDRRNLFKGSENPTLKEGRISH